MKRAPFIKIIALLSLVGLTVVAGCVHKSGTSATEVTGDAPAATEAPVDAGVVVPPATTQATLERREMGLPKRDDLGQTIRKIRIKLSYADVHIVGNEPKKKGRFGIQRVEGDETCSVELTERDGELVLLDAVAKATALSGTQKLFAKSSIPNGLRCRYSVDIAMPKATELDVDLKRGAILVENWTEPSSLKMEWGDVDVGDVGALNVNCGRCTLTGENISGALRFNVDTGNVGLVGLGSSVEGQTLGDTILKWRKVKNDTRVKVVSKAGDVILSFPKNVPLAMELKVPRGEVFSNKITSTESGTPVSVLAELGNIRVYRATE